MENETLNTHETANGIKSDVMGSAYEIIKELAEWSKKYPRQQIYAMHRKDKMDGELIAIEEKAKHFMEEWQKHCP